MDKFNGYIEPWRLELLERSLCVWVTYMLGPAARALETFATDMGTSLVLAHLLCVLLERNLFSKEYGLFIPALPSNMQQRRRVAWRDGSASASRLSKLDAKFSGGGGGDDEDELDAMARTVDSSSARDLAGGGGAEQGEASEADDWRPLLSVAQAKHNFARLFDIMREEGLSVHLAPSEAVCGQRDKLAVMVMSLAQAYYVRRFSVRQRPGAGLANDALQPTMLAAVKQLFTQRRPPGVKLTTLVNFTSCWQDGTLFVALLWSLNKDAVSLRDTASLSVDERLQLAFAGFTMHFGVPEFVSTSSIRDTPEENTIALYVATVVSAAAKARKNGSSDGVADPASTVAFAEVTRERDGLAAQLEEVKAEYRSKRDEVDRLTVQLYEAEAKNVRPLEQLDTAEAALAEAKIELRRLTSEGQRLRERFAQFREEAEAAVARAFDERDHALTKLKDAMSLVQETAKRNKMLEVQLRMAKAESHDNGVPAPKGESITLVFTDIQSSTALWEANPEVMEQALALHNDCVRRMLPHYRGYEVKTEGDAFMLAFDSALEAVACCAAIQVALLRLPWPDELLSADYSYCAPFYSTGTSASDESVLLWRGLRVRMGIHTGSPNVKEDPTSGRTDYFGPMVNRAARVGSSAQGGQIIVSGSTFEVIESVLPSLAPPIVGKRLGRFMLKGITEDVELFELAPAVLSAREFDLAKLDRVVEGAGAGAGPSDAMAGSADALARDASQAANSASRLRIDPLMLAFEVDSSHRTASHLAQKIDALIAQSDQRQASLKSAHTQLASFDIDSSADEIPALRRQVAALKASVDDAMHDIAAHVKELADQRLLVAQQTESLTQLLEDTKILRKLYRRASASNPSANAGVIALLESRRQTDADELKAARDSVRNLTDRLAEARTTIQGLRIELTNIRAAQNGVRSLGTSTGAISLSGFVPTIALTDNDNLRTALDAPPAGAPRQRQRSRTGSVPSHSQPSANAPQRSLRRSRSPVILAPLATAPGPGTPASNSVSIPTSVASSAPTVSSSRTSLSPAGLAISPDGAAGDAVVESRQPPVLITKSQSDRTLDDASSHRPGRTRTRTRIRRHSRSPSFGGAAAPAPDEEALAQPGRDGEARRSLNVHGASPDERHASVSPVSRNGLSPSSRDDDEADQLLANVAQNLDAMNAGGSSMMATVSRGLGTGALAAKSGSRARVAVRKASTSLLDSKDIDSSASLDQSDTGSM